MTKNIVIVGGGFAGTAVANALEKSLAASNDQEHRLILIESVGIFIKSKLHVSIIYLIP